MSLEAELRQKTYFFESKYGPTYTRLNARKTSLQHGKVINDTRKAVIVMNNIIKDAKRKYDLDRNNRDNATSLGPGQYDCFIKDFNKSSEDELKYLDSNDILYGFWLTAKDFYTIEYIKRVPGREINPDENVLR